MLDYFISNIFYINKTVNLFLILIQNKSRNFATTTIFKKSDKNMKIFFFFILYQMLRYKVQNLSSFSAFLCLTFPESYTE